MKWSFEMEMKINWNPLKAIRLGDKSECNAQMRNWWMCRCLWYACCLWYPLNHRLNAAKIFDRLKYMNCLPLFKLNEIDRKHKSGHMESEQQKYISIWFCSSSFLDFVSKCKCFFCGVPIQCFPIDTYCVKLDGLFNLIR